MKTHSIDCWLQTWFWHIILYIFFVSKIKKKTVKKYPEWNKSTPISPIEIILSVFIQNNSCQLIGYYFFFWNILQIRYCVLHTKKSIRYPTFQIALGQINWSSFRIANVLVKRFNIFFFNTISLVLISNPSIHF